MSKHFTLEEATIQINDWRQSKKGARGRIPEYSWRHAVRLSKEHTAKIVAKEMGFKLPDLESKIQDFKAPLNHTKILKKEKLEKKPSEIYDPFIKIPDALFNSLHVEKFPSEIGVDQKVNSIEKCILELDLNNGMKLRIFE